MLFTGQFEHSIDAKQRLAVPAEIRNRWDATRDGAAWYAVPWLSDAGGVIRLYTENEFHRRSAIGDATLLPDEDEARIQQTLFGLARRIEPDSAGRVRLPEDLLQFVSIRTDVTLVGAGDRLDRKSVV